MAPTPNGPVRPYSPVRRRGPLWAFWAYESELVELTVRIPYGLWSKARAVAIGSNMQLLMEHALLLYLGGRLPPRLLRGREWPEEQVLDSNPPYLRTELKRFSVRIPRRMARWARVWAAEADISDQALIARVLHWYIQSKKTPPFKKDAKRDISGQLLIWQRLIALEFADSRESVVRASMLLTRRRLMFRMRSAEPPKKAS